VLWLLSEGASLVVSTLWIGDRNTPIFKFEKGTAMVSTSNDGIMSEYLVKYALVKTSERERPTELLETLYISERFQAGEDLKSVKDNYDHPVWNGVPASEIDQRLVALDTFMKELARNRAAMWGVN